MKLILHVKLGMLTATVRAVMMAIQPKKTKENVAKLKF